MIFKDLKPGEEGVFLSDIKLPKRPVPVFKKLKAELPYPEFTSKVVNAIGMNDGGFLWVADDAEVIRTAT